MGPTVHTHMRNNVNLQDPYDSKVACSPTTLFTQTLCVYCELIKNKIKNPFLNQHAHCTQIYSGCHLQIVLLYDTSAYPVWCRRVCK